MFSPTRPMRTENPLEGLSDKQVAVLSERYGNGPRLTPLHLIGLRLGIKRAAVCRLIARGLANLAVNGWTITDLPGPFRPELSAA